MMKRIRDAFRREGVVRRFGRDRSGAAALMFGLTAVPLVLAAGVASGIDPHRGPDAARAFRRAEESGLRQIHLGGRDGERAATPAPTAGSGGSAGSNMP